VKLAAGWLIEQAGVPRGTRFGRVGLSTRHALALVNLGDATARDVLDAALAIKRGVLEIFGVALRPEPELLGFDPSETAELLA
jgi:UDP-N-acetylmuramate dehydrogenase